MEMLALGAQETGSAIDRLLVFSEDKSDDFNVGPSNWNFRRSIFEVSPDCLLDTSINYTQLKSWIENCDKEHSHLVTCRATSDDLSPDGFQLLDVRTGDVAPGQGKTYAALSYVWGPPPDLSISNEEQVCLLPKTIKDAMEVTQKLGLDYLWVDRYCIPQHDKEKKQYQIKNMHRIYRRAHFTIVAAAGDRPECGLPGVSSTRKLPSHLLIENRLFVGNPGDLLADSNAIIHESPWNSRAWTYQEKMFSRKILYFTETGVVFHCKSNFHGVEDSIRNYLCPTERPLVHRVERRGPTTPQALILEKAFNELTREFNRRQITREADRVDAIAGILSDMESRGRIHGHVAGVLIFKEFPNSLNPFFGLGFTAMETKNWDSGFLTGLCWNIQQCKGRRDEFPSWSWVGWNGLYNGNAEIRPDLTSLKFELEISPHTIATLQQHISLEDDIEKLPSSSDVYLVRTEQLGLIRSIGMMEESMCRFIHIKAAVVDFTCKMDGDGGWRLASLMGFAIHEETKTPVQFLPQGDSRLPNPSAFEKFQGLVFFDINWSSIFVIVLRDCGTFSERIGSWTAHTSILFPSGGTDETISEIKIRHEKDSEKSLALIYPIENFLRNKRAIVRLG